MLLLDDSSANALAVDRRLPPSAKAVSAVMTQAWPRLDGRVTFEERSIDDVVLSPDDVVVSIHGCGALTDVVLDRAVSAGARVAVLPCCHDEQTCDAGSLDGWIDMSLAVDVTRARRLVERGYDVHTHLIPSTITPKNRLLFGEPRRSAK